MKGIEEMEGILEMGSKAKGTAMRDTRLEGLRDTSPMAS